MVTIEEVVADQCDLIAKLQAELQEIIDMADAENLDTKGASAADCFRQMREAANDARKEAAEFDGECDRKDEDIKDLTAKIEQMDKDAEIKDDDITDALSDFLISMGYAARPLRSTGIKELDDLVQAVWG